MFRMLLVLSCLSFALNVTAQNKGKSTGKITEKETDTEIEYREVGTPMPPLRMIVYTDTAGKTDSVLVSTAAKSKKKKKKNSDPVAPGPKKVLTNADVDNDANLFVMIFNPTCSHCEEETVMIEKNISLFKKSKFLMMATPAMQPYLSDFYTLLNIGKYSDVISVGVDSAGFTTKVFLYQALPQINVYSGSERKLIKTYTGEVAIDTLKKYIE